MRSFLEKLQAHKQFSEVKKICDTLHAAGHEAYLAGGCVRDLLLGLNPKDFDIATSAAPEVVESMFSGAITVGKQFGTIVLPFDGFQIEVTTFREDMEYIDGRHPEGVRFTSAEEDAKRRDFTINALFYDLRKNEVLDFVDGQKDLQGRVIRAVGEPMRRFKEDKLRMMRAVRFRAQLGFDIDPATFLAIQSYAKEIHQVSMERIHNEIMKMLHAKDVVWGLKSFYESGLYKEIFPHLHVSEMYGSDLVPSNAFLFSCKMLENLPKQTGTLMAGFFSGFALSKNVSLKAMESELRAIKFANRDLDEAMYILKYSMFFRDSRQIDFAPAVFKKIFADKNAPRLWEFLARLEEMQMLSVEVRKNAERVLEKKLPYDLPKPFLTGKEVMALGVEQGPLLGDIMDAVYEAQLNGEVHSEREALHFIRLNFLS